MLKVLEKIWAIFSFKIFIFNRFETKEVMQNSEDFLHADLRTLETL